MIGLRTAKLFDLSIQLVLSTAILCCCFLDANKLFFAGCLLLAIWQLGSVAIHQFDKRLSHKETFRWWFHRAVLIMLISCVVPFTILQLSDFWPILIFGYVVLLSAPVMAIVYIGLCAVELLQLKRKNSGDPSSRTL